MLVVRTLFFDLFRIPSPSMEKSLLVGDYLFVSKLHYGTRTPLTLGIPFTQVHLKGIELPHTRLPGFDDVDRGDPIVFNWPPEDKPIDRKMHYIKRVIGLPGETLQIQNKVVSVDGKPLDLMSEMQQYWMVYKKDPRYRLPDAQLHDAGVSEIQESADPGVLRIVGTPAAAATIRAWPWIDRVEPFIAPSINAYQANIFPAGRGWTEDNYGPVLIPKKGLTITLTDENWPLYEPTITRFEEHTVRPLGDGQFEIDGAVTSTYTFEQNYFFVMGDNRDNSEDSRYWGFVPMNHIVGKAIMVYFSWDAERSLPRFNRLFHIIDDDLPTR